MGESASDEPPALTPEQERGIHEALESLRRGEGRTLDEVRRALEAASAKTR